MRATAMVMAMVLIGGLAAMASADGEDGLNGEWVRVTEAAAFSPRDTAEDCVFDGKMWISNGYYHGGVLTRDLWNTTDGVNWTRVSEATPYDGYSEMVAYDEKMWAVKGSVWRSSDGVSWEQVLEKTPFGVCGYGELVVFEGKMWQLGSGADVWNTTDGVNWTRVTGDAPYESRSAAAVTVFDGKLWVMGGKVSRPNDPPEQGYKDITTLNDVWCSADGANWERVVEHAPWAERMWFPAVAWAGRLWVLGGFDNRHHQNFGDVWYTEDGVNWHELRSEPAWSPRHEPTMYIYDGSLWLVAGNSWPVQNDVWRLTLHEGE